MPVISPTQPGALDVAAERRGVRERRGIHHQAGAGNTRPQNPVDDETTRR